MKLVHFLSRAVVISPVVSSNVASFFCEGEDCFSEEGKVRYGTSTPGPPPCGGERGGGLNWDGDT